MQMAVCEYLTTINQKLTYKIGNRLAGKSEYLFITYKLTEFIFIFEAKYSAVV